MWTIQRNCIENVTTFIIFWKALFWRKLQLPLQGIKLNRQTYCDSALCGKMHICMSQLSTKQLSQAKTSVKSIENKSRRKVLLCICQSAGLGISVFFCIIKKLTLSYNPNYLHKRTGRWKIILDDKSSRTLPLKMIFLGEGLVRVSTAPYALSSPHWAGRSVRAHLNWTHPADLNWTSLAGLSWTSLADLSFLGERKRRRTPRFSPDQHNKLKRIIGKCCQVCPVEYVH